MYLSGHGVVAAVVLSIFMYLGMKAVGSTQGTVRENDKSTKSTIPTALLKSFYWQDTKMIDRSRLMISFGSDKYHYIFLAVCIFICHRDRCVKYIILPSTNYFIRLKIFNPKPDDGVALIPYPARKMFF